ncbi:unnamed protein product [Ectocarpus sp. 8 AP-2014]
MMASGGTPPSFVDGGGGGSGSGGGGVGEAESPGRRTRKGMVLVEATGLPNTSYEFEAEVMVLHHPGVIRENYQPVVHAHNICQSARITSMLLSTAAVDSAGVTPPPAAAAPAPAPAPAPAAAVDSTEKAAPAPAPAAPAAPAPAPVDSTATAGPAPAGAGAGGGAIETAVVESEEAGAIETGAGPGLARAAPSAGIKSGERAVCRFRFLYRPEYLSVGTTIVLREGRTRGFGKIISVH